MPKCPQCGKSLAGLPRKCPTCQADLDLLVDFVNHLQDGLERARDFAREGELGKAVWSYLAVLEVDPDNPEARRQVGQIATSVRQFDATSPKRRWLKVEGWRRAFSIQDNPFLPWIWVVVVLGLMAGAFFLGYYLAESPEGTTDPPPEPPRIEKPKNTLG